ncbi:histone deacetylase complex subunit SAP130-A isoform X2 [Penaeus vannamei]|uniref:histone deacetylase complex subunit SAP130-A isoform X2 n=1 Tax=Penaeus vannamei TaxID=6689 RepID=UPI00387FAECD
MAGRGGLMTSGGGGSGSAGDPSNQPMDLAQKTVARSLESGGIVKSGGTTVVHYTTGVQQILATSGTTAHVVTAKSIGRTESMGVAGQTVTLVSRPSAPPSALNLASQGPGGGGGGPSLRTVSHAPGGTTTSTVVTSASTYHIPRGAAAVANIAAPRSQTVATPIMRTSAQPIGQPGSNVPGPRGSVVGQRLVPASTNGGWIRNTPSPAHTGKVTGLSMHPGVTAPNVSLGVQRPSMPMPRLGPGGGAITTYHTGVRPGIVSSGSIRGPGTATMRGMVTSEGAKGTGPKAVHITQPIGPQKYGGMGGVMSGSGRSVVASGGGAGGGSSSGTIYSPGNPMVTTMSGPGVNPQTTIRTQAPPAIAVRITTAPVSTATSSSQVTSQAGTSIGAISMTSPSGSSPGAILTHQSPLHRTQQDQVPLKTPIVRTPVASHQSKGGVQAQTLAFSDGPKVITQPAQGPPLALAQISGLAGVTTQKAQVNTHTVSQQHTPNVQHRPGGSVMGSSVGRVMGGTGIPVAKVLPQQATTPNQGAASVAGPPRGSHGQVRAQSPGQAADPQAPHTNVFLQRPHAGVTVTSGTPTGQAERVVTTVPQYSIAPPYYYEQGQNTYQVGGPTLVPHTLSSTHYVPTNVQSGSLRVTGGGPNASAGAAPGHGGGPGQIVEGPGGQAPAPLPAMKPGASPRPSILRKRPDSDGTPLKAAKNLTAALCLPMPSPPSPKRPDSRGNGNASSGSTTISANSSPGLQIEELDGNSGGAATGNSAELRTPPSIKQEPPEDATVVLPRQPVLCSMSETSAGLTTGIVTTTLNVPQPHLSVTSMHGASQALADGLSPRKKPRKQQLTGNELQEARSSEDDLDHPPVKKTKREIAEDNHDLEGSEDEGGGWSEPGGGSSGGSYGGSGGGLGGANASNAVNATVVITNRPTMSLLSSFRQTWKPRHNHFVRHTDVKPKDERRLTVNEIANQKMALQRVNGWKVVHLSGQVDDLVELESDVVDRLHLLLTSLEKRTHGRKPYKDFDKDINRLSELVKANIQRSKIIKDQMTEARTQMEKLFEHKGKIVEIMTKYSSKRSVRKKEKS